ncbi:MAG TPA: carboxypeptidase regulatory-like domain-containing protein [Terriglobales bacterium]|nr:carboxypeptidase regulatory-like domain-containing protein [Terriglobales bacterium]
MSRFLLRATALFTFVFVFTFSLPAQIQNGQFSGTVLDQSGAAIPNAKVTVKNLGTGLTVTTSSNQTGSYTVREVPPGLYSLSAQAKGFKTSTLTNMTLNAGSIQRADFHLEVGQVSQTVEVSGAAPAVNTEDSKLASTVSSTQIGNLPLNGRNVYDLIQMAPGAVNVQGVDFENGHSTVVNGLREDFNGFLLNGVSNKGLSGGVNNVPIQDTVQEFQELTLNNSAQYGNSAGSITNLVSKTGTNSFHGSGWDFLRNDKLDANQFFLNQAGVPKPKLRFNQLGGTFGGPIIKDKLFFFIAYQQDHFNTIAPPITTISETDAFRKIVTTTPALSNTVAKLLYNSFPPTVPESSAGCSTIAQGPAGAPIITATDGTVSTESLSGIGYVDARIGALNAALPTTGIPYECPSVALFHQQTQTIGNLFQGKEASGRIDYQPNDRNRFFIQYNWLRQSDQFGPCSAPCTRGFTNPQDIVEPNGQASWVHTFSPAVLNEARAGYTSNINNIHTGLPGVPAVYFDDGTTGFGSYNGYPQFFKEHVYSYGDMVSINHGNHNIKIGADFKRNLENSEFNVARPSYSFHDPVYFAADAPYFEVAGVDPGFVSGTNAAQLSSNVRHWRNVEFGAYVQDDWKATRRLTLNLGLRYDLYTRHTELNNLVTQFILGPSTTFTGGDVLTNPGATLYAAGLQSANSPAGCPGGASVFDSKSVLAGECGPGGFAKASALGSGDHNNFGPRLGFAWDVFGNGKTALRGGFGVSYESTLYNPLSNSRWNPPFYSFNLGDDFNLDGGTSNVIYGPMTCSGSLTATAAGQCAPSGAAPTFLGPATNIGQGIGSQAVGNISGWYPGNPDTAYLTGVVPRNIRDPYVYNWYLGLQHELAPTMTLELDYVATAGHKLFRADNLNRMPGARLPLGSCVQDNLGQTLCGLPGHKINENYGTLRNWLNNVNSNYNALQVALKKRASHGLLFNVSYTWSHSLDYGSTWHSGATTANGAAAGDGYTTEWIHPKLDYGNSIFDIRHRLVANYVIQLPGQHLHGVLGAIAGGWSYNGIWSFQTGPHWSPYNRASADLVNGAGDPCTAADVNSGNCINAGGDYMLSSISSTDRNARPDANISGFNSATHDMWANGYGSAFVCTDGDCRTSTVFSAPCLACVGTLRRNQFVGPNQWIADMSLFKGFKVTERVGLQFRVEGFNVFNRTNFLLASTSSGTTGPHNRIDLSNFGQAGATLAPRELQLGMKIDF